MILILTPYLFNPLHLRLEYIEKYLAKNKKVLINHSETKFTKILNILKFSIKLVVKKEKNRCFDIGILICQK